MKPFLLGGVLLMLLLGCMNISIPVPPPWIFFVEKDAATQEVHYESTVEQLIKNHDKGLGFRKYVWLHHYNGTEFESPLMGSTAPYTDPLRYQSLALTTPVPSTRNHGDRPSVR